MKLLENKVAIVTGASRGIGEGIALKFAEQGANVAFTYVSSDEKAKGEVQIKDLILGAEIAGLAKDRDAYLKQQADAQFAWPERQLVDGVHKVLARHGVAWE